MLLLVRVLLLLCCIVPLVYCLSVAAPPAISIEGLSCSHDGGNVYQLKDVSYVLPRGAKVGLTGRNGCGKVRSDWRIDSGVIRVVMLL